MLCPRLWSRNLKFGLGSRHPIFSLRLQNDLFGSIINTNNHCIICTTSPACACPAMTVEGEPNFQALAPTIQNCLVSGFTALALPHYSQQFLRANILEHKTGIDLTVSSTPKKPSKNYTCFILRHFGLFLIHLLSKK